MFTFNQNHVKPLEVVWELCHTHHGWSSKNTVSLLPQDVCKPTH